MSDQRAQTMELMAKRSRVESEMREFEQILHVNNIGMREPLVDAEGFPRADVDVFAVRNARVRLIELSNDHKKLTNELAEALNGVLARPATSTSPTAVKEEEPIVAVDSKCKVFAVIDALLPDSPADMAGLKRGDGIVEFGSVSNAITGSGLLEKIAAQVQASENQTIALKVIRNFASDLDDTATITDIQLIPQKWSGRGLLGCHI
eukprot:Partr_v1_DN27311_c4_g2_i1_m46732 putative 26S Proteasome non-ATPase regulatory subunit